MIFGKSDLERSKAKLLSKLKEGTPRKKFAVLPVRLNNGKYIWLQEYWSFRVQGNLYFASYYCDYLKQEDVNRVANSIYGSTKGWKEL